MWTRKQFQGGTAPLVADDGLGGHAGLTRLLGDEYMSGTREHNTAGLIRRALGAGTTVEALPALGDTREIYVMPTVRCFVRTGDGDVTASAGTSHPVASDERFYFRVPPGHTHIAFTRDTADGFITVCPVA